MSHSENKPKTTQTSSTTVQNLNIQDTEGVTLANSAGNTINVLDQGALLAAGDIAIESLRTSEDSQRGARELISGVVDDAFTFGADAFYYGADIVDRSGGRVLEAANLAVDAADAASSRSLTFGRDVLGEAIAAVDVAGERSLTFGRDVLTETGGLIRGVFQDAIDTVGNVLAEGQAQVGESLQNINTIARQQSTSDAERVQDIAQKALIVGAVMVGLVVLAQVWRS